jgi:hypothetical protein
MKKFSLVIIALITFILNSWSQSDVSKARWKPKEIVIDGNDHEWTKPLNFTDKKSGLMFAIYNDNLNVYLDFSCYDEMKIRRLMSAGWSVELSSKEKKKKFDATINFPAMPKMALGITKSDNRSGQKVDVNLIVKAYLAETPVVLTKGFRSDQLRLKLNDRDNSNERVNIALGSDSLQNLVCEIAIPLKELLDENSFQLDELLTLNVSVNALERPSFGGGQASMSDGMPESGAGGGRSGGSKSGGGKGGIGNGRAGGLSLGGLSPGSDSMSGLGEMGNLFETVSIKQKFTLTKN